MTSNVNLKNGKLTVGEETVDLKEMNDNIVKLNFEKVGWVSVLGLLTSIVLLFNVFVIGTLNSFRTELNNFRTELNSFRTELTHFENSINGRFDKIDHRMDMFEQALIESNKRSDALFQELINIKTK